MGVEGRTEKHCFVASEEYGRKQVVEAWRRLRIGVGNWYTALKLEMCYVLLDQWRDWQLYHYIPSTKRLLGTNFVRNV